MPYEFIPERKGTKEEKDSRHLSISANIGLSSIGASFNDFERIFDDSLRKFYDILND